MKNMIKKMLRITLVGIKQWIAEQPSVPEQETIPPFDNSYKWISSAFRHIHRISRRANYSWGVLQGVALAKALGYTRVSVMEFGVAGGFGLVALERIAELVEKMTDVGIDVYGFDTGHGLPKPQDYRDMPYMWEEGYLAMDVPRLRERLKRTQLKLGLVETTVPEFVRTSFAPVAFISIDLDLYTATRHALQLLEAHHERMLPRVPCYFDDIMGYGCSEYTGERLAIMEFNNEHTLRKISPHYGLKYHVPPEHQHDQWVEMMYFAHVFDHPLYGTLDHQVTYKQIDVEGKWY